MIATRTKRTFGASRQGLAEDGLFVLVAPASGSGEADAVARRSLLLKRRIESASVSPPGE
jgi:hypothetical protein